MISPRAQLAPADRKALAAADLVVDQVADIAVDEALAGINTHARRVAIPVVGTAFLWPWTGTPHPDSISRHGSYNPFRAEMGDHWILRALKAGASPEEAVTKYMALNAPTAGNVDRRFELEMSNQRRRDEQTGFDAASLIERHFRHERLFLTPYHMGLRISRYLAVGLLKRIGAPSVCIDLLERYMTDSFSLKFELPVHPAIARHFGLAWADEHTRYRFHQEALVTFEEYAGRVARCEADSRLEEAIDAVAQGKPGSAALVEAAYPHDMPPARVSPWAKRALAQVRLGQGRFAEAEALFRSAIDDSPDEGSWLALGECLRRTGRETEAAEALRMGVSRAPYKHGSRIAFARALTRIGRVRDALLEVDEAIALCPNSKKYEAYRRKLLEEAGLDQLHPQDA